MEIPVTLRTVRRPALAGVGPGRSLVPASAPADRLSTRTPRPVARLPVSRPDRDAVRRRFAPEIPVAPSAVTGPALAGAVLGNALPAASAPAVRLRAGRPRPVARSRFVGLGPAAAPGAATEIPAVRRAALGRTLITASGPAVLPAAATPRTVVRPRLPRPGPATRR